MGLSDKFKKMNPKVPPILVMVLPLVVAGLFYMYIAVPMAEEKENLDTEYSAMQVKLENSRIAERNRQSFKEAVEKLDAELKSAQERLPTSEQMDKLLNRINELAKKTGLKLNTWNVGQPVTDPLQLYNETLVTCEVIGSFHEVGKFMEGMDGMTRLITVTNLDMSSATLQKYDMAIPTKFTLKAYSAPGGN